MTKGTSAIESSELQFLGVPFDGEVVERAQSGLDIHILNIYLKNIILDLPLGGIVLAIHVAISNESACPIRLDECRVNLPWVDQDFGLLQVPRQKVLGEHVYMSLREPQLAFEREAVLNHRFGRQGRLNPGGVLDGMILAEGSQSIPDHFQHRQRIEIELVIFDGRGRIYRSSAGVMLDRKDELKRKQEAHKRAIATKLTRISLFAEEVSA